MMRVRALKSFCGAVTMRRGQETELADSPVLTDLLRAGYIEILHTDEALPDEEQEIAEKSEEKADEALPDEGQEIAEKPKKKGSKGGDAK